MQRLSFHLPGEQSVYFGDDAEIEDVINTEGSESSMFLEWMKSNKTEPKARGLTCSEFLGKFVWGKK